MILEQDELRLYRFLAEQPGSFSNEAPGQTAVFPGDHVAFSEITPSS